MTRIRTFEELQQNLNDELTWRRKELGIIKSLIPQAKSTSKISTTEVVNCYVHSGIALLYAHWEGFVKVAGNLYLEYIIFQRLKYEDLTNNFVAMAAKKHLSDFGFSNKVTDHIKVADFFLSGLGERCTHFATIETKSNLSTAVLKEILSALGLDYRDYETKANLIEALRNTRNNIAHGRFSTVDVDMFLEYHDKMIDLMELFANQISNAASTQAYKR
jgi:hypothetical protein